MSSSHLVIGTPNKNVGNLTAAGNAYIYTTNSIGLWSYAAKQWDWSDPKQDDRFCNSVAIDGVTAIYGEFLDDPWYGNPFIEHANQGSAFIENLK